MLRPAAVLGTAGPGTKNICGALVLYNFYLFSLGVGPLLDTIGAGPGEMAPLKPPLAQTPG